MAMRRITLTTLQRAGVLLSFVLVFPLTLLGQSSAPTARTPGAPAGSYQLADLETVNLFSGNLNFNLPLHAVGARGEVRQVLSLVLETQWNVNISEDSNGYRYYEFNTKQPNPDAFVGFVQSEGSAVTDYQSECGNPGVAYLTNHQFNFSYVEPDGTEHMLVDPTYHGRPFSTCSYNVFYGRTFESIDGSFITFITDADVSTTTFAITGYLYFKNGTKSRIVDGKILWTRDRNGNLLEYTYEPGSYPKRLLKIKGQIGREVNIEYGITEAAPYGLCDRILYKGFEGHDRIIRISKAPLHNILRTTRPYDSATTKTMSELFPDYPNDNNVLINPNVVFDSDETVSAIWLPDGRSYQFRYNVYGRLARVELPTGGAVEYDYERTDNDGGYYEFVVNRVKEKRSYESSDLTARTLFTATIGGATEVDVENFDSTGVRMSKSRHFFSGYPNGSFGYVVPWWNGKEIKTETFDSDGVTLLQTREMNWKQRIPSWCFNNPNVPNACGLNPQETAPTINPFVAETKLTLASGNLVSKVSGINPDGSLAFDSYNNQTDFWEYGFGTAQPGSLLRHTLYSYINNANPSAGLFLLGLVNTQNVYA